VTSPAPLRTFQAFLDLHDRPMAPDQAGKWPRTGAAFDALQRDIERLEACAGLGLFRRPLSAGMLTEAGQMLLPHVRRLVREHDAALAAVRRARVTTRD